MNNKLYKKTLVLGTIILLFGMSTVSALNNYSEPTKMIETIVTPTTDVDTFNPTDDATILQPKPNDPNTGLKIRNHGDGGWTWQGLIKFDISTIPSNAEIISATLNCFYRTFADNNPTGHVINLYRLTSDWMEETVTWNTQPTYVFQPTSYIIMPSSPGVWLQWDVKSDIENFVKGLEDNFGWKISDDTLWPWPDIPITRLNYKEYESDIPYLEIEFTRSRSREITNPFLIRLFECFPNAFPILRQLLGFQ
ncbi:MAG: DNRLRE domain-containing protein [Thermoplasmatales archaeon]|nr:MAG: DNRLRE domain-containing protein [Thermoplasmatales archaeon]